MIDLHVHTKYSLLDSIIEPENLIAKTKELNKSAICITEHGNLYSSIETYKLCQKYGIKYLHGCEVYTCNDVHVNNKNDKYYHLILISKNEIGRLNLIKIVSLSNQYKYWGKPRIDFEILKQYKDGIIVLSACMAGEIQRALMNDDINKAKSIALKYKNEFQDDYYLEYQSHSDPLQQKLNRTIVDIANELNIKYVVTTDAHYVDKQDQKYHSIFVQIGQSREVGETYTDCYIQSEEDIYEICKTTTQQENMLAIKNTHEIAEKCNVQIPLSAPIMIHIDIPEKYKTEKEYLQYLCIDGWKKRKINLLSKDLQEEYKKRLKYEIDVITRMGFEGYFLLVWSYANSVKRRGIARGSGGGSLVAYLINIVDIDPVRYGLYFERFIDVGALQLLEEGKITKNELKIPDFDLDFGKEDRNKVINNIIQTYGKERFASLGSFQYIWAKGAIKDIGKVLGIPFEETNEMTKKLSDESIQEALDLGLLDTYKEKYPELFIYATKLAGLPKSFSMHPCGKIITMNNVDYYNAVEIDKDGFGYVLQGDMHTAEDLGLIKIDILGLRNVDVIYDTLESIKKDYDYIAPHNLNFEDTNVLNNFKNGLTSLIFQFESAGMKKTLKNIECSSLYDLFVANALFRPGSMDYIENYANRRKGIEEYQFLHEDLHDILKDSYAIIVFQEQLIEIGKLANLNNPDELRQATAKKKEKLLNKIKPELFSKLGQRCWSEEQLNELWDIMIKFAKYSFNKSHSAAYAIIAYICMYLKTYHPKDFIVSCINSFGGKVEKLPECFEEAKRIGIEIKIPQWNNFKPTTFYKNNTIFIGTQTIKYLNYQIGEELQKLSNQQYNCFYDLLFDIKNKTSLDSRQLNILILLNCFSEFGKINKLLKFVEYFDALNDIKQISKLKVNKFNVPENIIKKYSRETEKTYMDLNNKSILQEIWNSIENKQLSLREQIKAELEYLNYILFTEPRAGKDFYVITELKTYQNQCKPYLTLYQLKTGDVLKTKIKDEKEFSQNPLKMFDLIKIEEFKTERKNKKIDGKWVKSEETEEILAKWQVI